MKTVPVLHLLLLLGLILAPNLPAQENMRAPARQALEMQKVRFLLGKWSGGGWVERGQRRYTFKETKHVQPKMKNRVFIIEGTQVVLLNDREESDPFDMLAILSFNELEGVYRFRSHLANGYAGDHTAKMEQGALEWQYEDPELGPTRYRIRLDEKGRWLETGEFNKDGAGWKRFYENILSKVEGS